MPYADPELRKWSLRMSVRNHSHPGWRQWYLDCGGICVAPVADSNGWLWPCGESDGLEFHAPEGESNSDYRILLCRKHHMEEHPERQLDLMPDENYQYKKSMLSDDVIFEIWKCGGTDNWIRKFNLADTAFCRFPVNKE